MAVLPVLCGPMWTSRAPAGSRLRWRTSRRRLSRPPGAPGRTSPSGRMPAMESSPTRPRNVAVLLAGGVGVRIGLDIPKQLIKVAGKTILEHTLDRAAQPPDGRRGHVMMAPGHLDAVRAIVRNGGYDKVTDILEGGETRNDTTLARAGRPRRRRVQRPLPRRRPAAGDRTDHHRVLRGPRDPPGRRRRDPARPTRSSRSTTTTRSARSRREQPCGAARRRRPSAAR